MVGMHTSQFNIQPRSHTGSGTKLYKMDWVTLTVGCSCSAIKKASFKNRLTLFCSPGPKSEFSTKVNAFMARKDAQLLTVVRHLKIDPAPTFFHQNTSNRTPPLPLKNCGTRLLREERTPTRIKRQMPK